MRFSVIVPVYQVKDFLRQCLNSILRQTFTDFELILVDDGSTDGSAAICAEYAAADERVRVITQPNGGLSVARNTGIRAAQGDYLIFLDSDDFWATKYGLEEISSHLSDSAVDAVFWRFRRVGENDNTFTDEACGSFPYESCRVPEDAVRFIRSRQLIACAWDVAIARRLFSDGTMLFEQGVISEDAEWLARLLQRMKRCVFSQMALVAYRVRGGSITKKPKEEKVLIDLNHHYSRIVGYIDSADEATADLLRVYLGELAANYLRTLSKAPPKMAKAYRDSVCLKYLRYGVTSRSKAMKVMTRLCGVSGTVFLIRKIKRL